MNVDSSPQMRAESSDRDVLLPVLGMGDALRDLWEKLRRHAGFLIGSILGAILLAVFYVLTAAPLYTANGSILIDPRVGQNPDSGSQMMPGLLMSDALTVDSELRVLTSREVTTAAVHILEIPTPEDAGPGLRQRLAAFLGLDESNGQPDTSGLSDAQRQARQTEALRRTFTRNLRVARSGESFVIDIAYTSPDPGFAAEAVNVLIREYQRQTGQQQVANVERNQIWLEGRINELRGAVEAAETAVADFRGENELLTPPGQLLPTEIALNFAIQEMVRLRAEALAIKVGAEQLAEQIDAGQIDAVVLTQAERSQALSEFEARLAELQQREQELLLNWAEDSSVVRSIRQQQDQTRTLILDEYRQILARLNSSAEAVERRVLAIDQVIDGLRDQYGEDTQKIVVLRSLEREAESKRQLYERLLEEYNSASQLLTFDAASARVIAWAVPPDQKSAPQSRQIVILAAFAAVVLATAGIFLYEALDSTFRKPVDVTGDIGLRFLGALPTFRSETVGGLRRFSRVFNPLMRGGRWRRLSRAARWLDFAAFSPTSFTADSMRMLHAQLAAQRRRSGRTDGATIVGFTSSIHSEGKTTTAANFANFVAQRHERVVLVDMDLITSQLSRLIGPILPETNALSRFVEDADQAIETLTPIPELPGLAVIGNNDGKVPRSVTPRSVKLFETMFSQLRQHFDYIVVDLPPALGAADTQILASLCDELIYLIRWGSTPRAQVQSALQGRGLDKKSIFGVLYTRAPLKRYRSYNTYEVNDYYA